MLLCASAALLLPAAWSVAGGSVAGGSAAAGSPDSEALPKAFPLWARIDYRQAAPFVTVQGNTLPGAVVQAREASAVVGGSGTYTVTEHAPATIIVHHVQNGTTHRGTLAKGTFLVGVPLVPPSTTLQWWLQIGPLRWRGPDLSLRVQ